MATDKFVPGDLVLVNFPGSGYWPCQVSRIISKNWRQVEYLGDGDEIGKAHVQVIRDYDEATKDDLEELIPKKRMNKDPVLRQAVKQINQRLAGKKTRTSGEGIITRSESMKISDKKETGGKHKSQITSEKKEVTSAIKKTRTNRQRKEFIDTKKDVKKTARKKELKKKEIAKKKEFIVTRNKTKKITGINKIISTTKKNDKMKENLRNLRAGVSGDSSSTNSNMETSPIYLGRIDSSTWNDLGSSFANNLKDPSSGANNNHGVADDVDIINKCEIDEDANNNLDTLGTEDRNPPTTAEDAMIPDMLASLENGGAFPAEDISAQETTANCSLVSSEILALEVAAPRSSASSDNNEPNAPEHISAQEGPAPDTDNSSATSTEGISANNLGQPGHNSQDTVKLNISLEMTPNTFSQISPALLTFVNQPNVSVHINVQHS